MADLSKLKYPKGIFLGKAAHDSGSFAVASLWRSSSITRPADHPSIVFTAGTRIVRVRAICRRKTAEVTQTGLCSQCCHHAGASTWKGLSGFNRLAIGIEQENWGYWRPGIRPATAEAARKAGWLDAVHQSGKGARMLWDSYPEIQIEANLDLCRWLIAEIPSIEYILGHDDIALYAARWTRAGVPDASLSRAPLPGQREQAREVQSHFHRQPERPRPTIVHRREAQVGRRGACAWHSG
jgi:hypothetical protein